jgi:DNA-binding GntR family transcriptional regulator
MLMPSNDIPIAKSKQPRFGAVRNRRIPDLVEEQIRDAILSGELKPGERLVEQKLSVQFGIGQPTLREALYALEHQGFVRKNGNRGTYVTQYSDEDIRKNLEVRTILEAFAVQNAARNLSDQDAEELRGIIADMQDCATRYDRPAFHKADVAFHRKIWEIADNSFLLATLERITFSVFAFSLIQRNPSDAVFTHVVEQHQSILDGLLTRDPRKARRAYQVCTLDFWREYHGVQVQDVLPEVPDV